MTAFDIYLDKLVKGENTNDDFPKNESTWEELFSFGKRCIDEIVLLRRRVAEKDAENKAVRDMLCEWDQAYSTEIFEEVSKEEIDQYSSLISRNSATMGRFMVGVLRRKIAEARGVDDEKII